MGHRGNVPFSSPHLKGTCYQPDLVVLMLALLSRLQQWVSGFSTVHYCVPLLPIVYSLEGSHYFLKVKTLLLKEWELHSISLRARNVYKLFGINLHVICLLTP